MKFKKNNNNEPKMDFYGYYFENATDAVIVIDRDGKTVSMNKKATEISGLSLKEALGKKFTELGILSPNSINLAIKNFKDKMKGKKVLPYVVEIIGKKKEPIRAEVNYLLIKSQKRIDGEVIVLREVTDKNQWESGIIVLNKALSLISKVNKLLVKSQSSKDLIDKLCRLIVNTKHYSIAWTGLIEEGKEGFVGIGFCGQKAAVLNKYLIDFNSQFFLNSHIGTALKAGKISPFRASSGEEDDAGLSGIYSKLGIKSALAIPLKDGSKVTGILLACSKDINAFIPEEISIFEEMGSDLAYGLRAIKIKSERDLAHQLLIWQKDLIFKLNQSKDLNYALSIAINAILSLPEITSGGFYLINEKKVSLDLIKSFGLSKKFVNEVSNFKLTSPQGKMVLAGKPVFITYEKLNIAKGDIHLKEGLKSIGIIPIIYQDEVIGCFNIASKKSYEISASTQKFLEITSQIFGVIVNRFKIENKINEEKKFSDEIIESIPGLFYVVDDKGNFLRWNRNQSLFLGAEEKNMATKNIFIDFVGLAENKSEFYNGLKDAKILGESLVDFSLKPTGQKRKYLNFTNKKVKIGEEEYLIGIGIDQTERRKVEADLEDAVIRYENIASNTTDFIFLKDKNRRYTFVNEAMEKLLKLPKEKIIGKTPEEIFPRLAAAKVKKADDICFSGNKFNSTEQLTLFGSDYYLHTVQSPIIGSKGEIVGVAGIVRDVTEQKKNESIMEQNEERLKIIYENAPDAIFLYDLKGVFIDGNKAAEKLVGIGRFDIIGKSLFSLKLLSKSSLDLASKILSKNSLGKPTGPDEFLIGKFGSKKIWIEVSTYPIKIGNKRLVLGVARDISVKKIAQEEIRLAYLHYETIFKASREVMIEIDRMGRIVYTSDMIESYGFKKSELVGKKIFSFVGIIGKEGVGSIIKAYKERMSGKEIKPYEIKIRTVDGRDLIAEVRSNSLKDGGGNILGALVTLTDVTERRKVMNEISQTAERYRTIFNSTSDIIIQVDLNGKIIDINKSIERYGYKQNLMIGMDIMEFGQKASLEDLNKMRDAFSRRLQGDKVPVYEIVLPSKDGILYNFEVYGTRVDDLSGNPTGSILVLHDLTDRKHNEEIIRSIARRYKMLFKSSRDILIQIDINNRILDVNDRINNYGYRRSDLIGKSINDIEKLFPKSEAEKIDNYINLHNQGADLKSIEVDLKDFSGRMVSMEIEINSLSDQSEKVIGNLLIIHDISDRKLKEREIKEKITELEKLNRLMVGRELRMSELKEEIKRLKIKK